MNYEVMLKSLHKSERIGKLNGHLVCLRYDDEKLNFVLDLSRKEKWERLEKNVLVLLAHRGRKNLNVCDETLIDFLDELDALRNELKEIPE
jgi:hypothetical protein